MLRAERAFPVRSPRRRPRSLPRHEAGRRRRRSHALPAVQRRPLPGYDSRWGLAVLCLGLQAGAASAAADLPWRRAERRCCCLRGGSGLPWASHRGAAAGGTRAGSAALCPCEGPGLERAGARRLGHSLGHPCGAGRAGHCTARALLAPASDPHRAPSGRGYSRAFRHLPRQPELRSPWHGSPSGPRKVRRSAGKLRKSRAGKATPAALPPALAGRALSRGASAPAATWAGEVSGRISKPPRRVLEGRRRAGLALAPFAPQSLPCPRGAGALLALGADHASALHQPRSDEGGLRALKSAKGGAGRKPSPGKPRELTSSPGSSSSGGESEASRGGGGC